MNGDLISRNALLSKMFPYGMPDNGNYGINARAVRDAIVGAKAVEAEPVVHAHWELRIDEDKDWGDLIDYKCSACGKFQFNESNYCPNCGVHTDEEVSE